MAELGVKATQMTDPSLGGAGFIAQGVQDNSGAISTNATTGLIGNAGTFGKELYKGKQLADVEADIEKKAIEEYMNRRDPSQLLTEAEGYNSANISLFKQPGTTPEELAPVQQKYKETMEKYARAKEQGAMSPEEFALRVTSSLREAVNKNPGMYEELKQQAAKVLELSGITGIQATDKLIKESTQASNEKYLARLQARMEKENLSYTAGTPVYVMEEQLQKAEGDTHSFNSLKRANELKDIMTKEQAVSWMEDKGDSAVRGGLNNFSSTVQALAEEAQSSPNDYPKIKASVSRQAMLAKDSFLQSIPVAYRNEPAVLQKITSYNNAIDSTLTMLDGLGSGADWKAAMTNHLDVTKAFQDQRVRDSIDVSSLQVAEQLAKIAPNIGLENTAFRGSVVDLAAALSSGNFNAPIIDKELPKTRNDKNLASFIDKGAKLGEANGDFTALNSVLDTFNNKAIAIKDPAQKQLFLANNIEALSRANLAGADTATIGKVRTMISTYLDDPKYGVPSMLSNVEKYNATMDVLPDGRLIFTGNEAQAFNEKFGVKINQALSAYANTHGLSIKEASPKFYPEYFKKHLTVASEMLLKDPDIKAKSTDEKGPKDSEVVTKMKRAKAAGATIEEIASTVRRSPEWVQANLG